MKEKKGNSFEERPTISKVKINRQVMEIIKLVNQTIRKMTQPDRINHLIYAASAIIADTIDKM